MLRKETRVQDPKHCTDQKQATLWICLLCGVGLFPHGSAPPVVSPLKRQVEPLAGCRFRAGRRRYSTWADPRHCIHSIRGGTTRWPGPRMRQVFPSLPPSPRPSLSSLHWEQVRPWGRVPSLRRAGAQGTHLGRVRCSLFLACSHPGPYTLLGSRYPRV